MFSQISVKAQSIPRDFFAFDYMCSSISGNTKLMKRQGLSGEIVNCTTMTFKGKTLLLNATLIELCARLVKEGNLDAPQNY